MTVDTVLVTGAAGGIGSATVATLAGEGHRVVGLDRLEAPPALDAAWIRHDLLDTAGTERLLATSPLLAGLRHVVAVAGGPTPEELGRLHPAEVPVDVFAASVELNLTAQYALVRGAAARLALTEQRIRPGGRSRGRRPA